MKKSIQANVAAKGLLMFLTLTCDVMAFSLEARTSVSFHNDVAGHAASQLPLKMTEKSNVEETNNENDEWESAEESTTNDKVVRFLQKKYPKFTNIFLSENDAFITALRENECNTIFVPSDDAVDELGSRKLQQLKDPRNLETKLKIGGYHLIPGEVVSATTIKTEDWTKGRPADGSKPNTVVAAVVTLSGEVPVGRRKSGGFFRFGRDKSSENSNIMIGPTATIVQSFQVEDCLIHEMDGLISPLAVWRYLDQLRIPGF